MKSSCFLWLLLVCELVCVTRGQGHAIEVLVFTVRAGDMRRYLAVDEAIWTSFLSCQDGFVSKTNLVGSRQSMENATEVYQMIEWTSLAQWKNISEDQLAQTNERFIEEFGYAPQLRPLPDDDGFKIVDVSDF